MTSKFFTLIFENHRWFKTREQATAALNLIIEQTGRNYSGCDIQEFENYEDFSGQERLAEQRNRLIDWQA